MPQFSFHDSLRTELHPCAVDFPETSFFGPRQASLNGSSPELPTPTEVREYTGNENYGTVALPELGLFVKWGREHLVRIEEAQSLQAIRRAFLNNEVPVPELVAWRSEDDINYLYMSLVPGVTLDSCWSTLTTEERSTIADQLGETLTTLRSVRQSHGNEYIGKSTMFVPHMVRWLTNHQAHSIMAQYRQSISKATPLALSPTPKSSMMLCNSGRWIGYPWRRGLQTPSDNSYQTTRPYASPTQTFIWATSCSLESRARDASLVWWIGAKLAGTQSFGSTCAWNVQRTATNGLKVDRVLKLCPDESETLTTYWSWRGPA